MTAEDMEVTADEIVATAWELHNGQLRGYLLRRTRDASVTDDLLQDTFLRLLQECRAGRCPRETRAWLYRVAHNALVSDVRRHGSAARATERLASRTQDEPDPEEMVIRRDDAARINAAFGDLHPAGRRAIGLAAAGFQSHEIAAALGRTNLAGRALLHRSRLRLRAAVAEPA
jgi:RNA polymerase sigma-70 factor, ECF subfamily